MKTQKVKLGDVASFRKISVKPEAGTTYHCYSLPAFDDDKTPEILDGSEILSNKLSINDNDILVNKLNMRFKRIWRINNLEQNSVCSTEFLPLVVNDDINRDFVYYVLLSDEFTRELSGMRTGTSGSHQRVKPEWILDYELNLPPLATQTQIARILSAFDSKIEVNNKLNAKLEELAQTLFENELSRKKLILELGDIVELEDSKRIPLNSLDRKARKGKYPYYGATTIMDYVNDYLFDGIRILLGEDGTVINEDDTPVLQYVWGKYWVNNHAHVIKSSSEYSLEEILIALKRTSVKQIVTGAVQLKINQQNLKSLQIELPEPNKLNELSNLFKLYRNNVEESRYLATLRDTLLPKLMRGELTPNT